MSELKNIIPKDIFSEIVDTLRSSVNVTSITQSGRFTTLFCTTTGISKGNYVTINCGDMQGDYIVNEVWNNRIVVPYTGNFTLGTIKTKPFFQWGNLKDGKISINNLNEFPLIYFVLPTPYDLDVDTLNRTFIDYPFQFLFINKYELPKGTKKTQTEEICESTVREMSDLSLSFSQAVKDSKYIIDAQFRRSEELPFGITFSGDSGSTETLVPQSAGVYLEARVKIKKTYNC